MDKFKEMWYELKNDIEEDLKFHQSGEMQTIRESIHGQAECEEMLKKMTILEIKHNIYL